MARTKKSLYFFEKGKAEGDASFSDILGNKGANLAELARLSCSVPPGFTLTTEVWESFRKEGNLTFDLKEEILKALRHLEQVTGKVLGNAKNPLFVSVRSGAPVSMPGMMETVLNVGFNASFLEVLEQQSELESFFYLENYWRFIRDYSVIVLESDFDFSAFETQWVQAKTVDKKKTVILEVLEDLQQQGCVIPSSVEEQIFLAVESVFRSWGSERACTYRRLHGLDDTLGTAATIQTMVFGNREGDSYTGVVFTRDPSSGEKHLYGEYLPNRQGEDLVSGLVTPYPLTVAQACAVGGDEQESLEIKNPVLFKELSDQAKALEQHFKDIQDLEFTVEQGKLYLLQARKGRRTIRAALRAAVEMVDEGLIDRKEALKRIDPLELDQILHPSLDPKAEKIILTTALPASPGAVSGQIVFNSDDAERKAQAGQSVILLRTETSPEDIHGIYAAAGTLTARGGMTSHAAVVARGMGRPCICGASDMRIDEERLSVQIGEHHLKQGDLITLDGVRGEVLLGRVPSVQPELSPFFERLMAWADEVRSLAVLANVDTADELMDAIRFGAEGVGLCRTERMFFEADRLLTVRRMILAQNVKAREEALERLAPSQKEDFKQMFRALKGRPAMFRLLDLPLQSFLPSTDVELRLIAEAEGVALQDVRLRAKVLQESNPMLGFRAGRLGVVYPEIYRMQCRVLFEAAVEVMQEQQTSFKVEVMLPFIVWRAEIRALREVIEGVAQKVKDHKGYDFGYDVGTMIELPKAALNAGDLATESDFFSFGTNDLTQTTCGISRDDSGAFLKSYLKKGLISEDPFIVLDPAVTELIDLGAQRIKAFDSQIKIGICGEQAGHPQAIRKCKDLPLDYLSCSPYRVPMARLTAAQIALES